MGQSSPSIGSPSRVMPHRPSVYETTASSRPSGVVAVKWIVST